MKRATLCNALWAWLATLAIATAQQPTHRPRVVIDEPVRLTGSFETLAGWRLELAPDFEGEAAVIAEGRGRRISHLVLRDLFVDGRQCDKPVAGVIVRNASASYLANVRTQRTMGPGLVLDSVWNCDVIAPQAMYCGRDGVSPACRIDGANALTGDPAMTPGGFWRDATNDVRIVAGRFEGSRVELACHHTTDVVVVGTKLHGDPQSRATAGPLAELRDPRGPHLLLPITTAHGAAPLVRVWGGSKQAKLIGLPADSDWPLRKERELFELVAPLPPGSTVLQLKTINGK